MKENRNRPSRAEINIIVTLTVILLALAAHSIALSCVPAYSDWYMQTFKSP